MICVFCEENIDDPNQMTVAVEGPAHQYCFQADFALRRTHQKLNIAILNDQELMELKDLVLTELNNRQRDITDGKKDIELF